MTLNNTTLGVSIAAVVLTVGFTLWWRRRARLPDKWREVGKLSQLFLYPMKSGKGIELDEAECTAIGLKHQHLRDRTFLMYEESTHNFLTGRKYPDMLLISFEAKGQDKVILSAPEMPQVTVNLSELKRMETCVVWGDAVEAADCGDAVALWISRFILRQESGLRLGYYTRNYTPRTTQKFHTVFPITKHDLGAYSDLSSYHLICQSSVDDLNTRLKDKVKPGRFRPNFVVEGGLPYEEDNWKWVKIGDVIFKNAKPCARCVLTTIDGETAVRDPAREPLQTLQTYRQYSDPKARKLEGNAPKMGLYLGVYRRGCIKVGDPVYVSE